MAQTVRIAPHTSHLLGHRDIPRRRHRPSRSASPILSALEPIKVPLLLVLGAIKFITVVSFFMHLRFDKKLYRNLFLFGAIGVFPLFLVVLFSMHAFV